VAKKSSATLTLAPGAATHVELELLVARPALWQIDSPALHHATITLHSPDGTALDTHTERFGIRRIDFSRSGGFTLNGRRLRLRGTNRHQEYPRVGYAVPAAAQRRDARRIKEAGFDYVRLSHYPQSPDFLDACDELGIVVMNCIPGWQIIGGEIFQAACVQNSRDLIRRDRNHPCVVLWELSLNETQMDEAFMTRLYSAGHEEYPGDQMFTCGWMDHFDVYIHSRQHGEIHRWQNRDKAMVIAEYGDWEFYASNHGFDQKTGAGIYSSSNHGRQLRAAGERGLRQQSFNHTIALNDTLSSPAVLDGQWSVFDYARGYDPNRAACGVMDIFRLPKFSYYFYRSQRDASAIGNGWSHGPMIFIASHWTPASDLRVIVFSNCDEVELILNGQTVSRQKPAKAWMTQYLPHPPFVFDLSAFTPGTLEARGFIGGQPAASHRVSTPEAPAQLTLEIETMDIAAAAGDADVLIAHASVLDARSTLCLNDTAPVTFKVEGEAEIVGPTSIAAEAGIASIVLHVPSHCRSFILSATRSGHEGIFTASSTWRHPSPAKLIAATA
jgi:beta-galactosidase